MRALSRPVMYVGANRPPPPKTRRSQSIVERLRWKWRSLWFPHRGTGTQPVIEEMLDFLASDHFGRFLTWSAVASLIILPAGHVIGMQWPARLSISGLTLDICGVLYLFKEWLLQHSRNAERDYESVQELCSKLAGEQPKAVEPLGPDEPYVVHVGKHLMDGVRDRLHEHVALAIPGIALLVLGFVLQLFAALISFMA